MNLSLPNKLEILLKLGEIYNIEPLYRASSREINEGFILKTNGRVFNAEGININAKILDNSLNELYRYGLIDRIRNGDVEIHGKAKYLYFILPRGNEISIEFWNRLKKTFQNILNINKNLDDLNENDVEEMVFLYEIIINGGLINEKIKRIASNLYDKILRLKDNSETIPEKLRYSSF